MSDREPICVAGVGAGYFSRFHYDAWTRIPGARLVAVADRSLEAAADRLRDAGSDAVAYGDVDRMLAERTPDLVDIVTPPETHAEMIEKAFAAGAATVICQKPFCGDLTTATRLTDRAAQLGRRLIVHENFRFQPWWRAARRAIEEGLCGRVRQITFRLRPGDGQGPEAYLSRQPYFQKMPRFLVHETGVHWVDVFRYLLGAPQEVFADLRRLNPAIAGEDAGYFLYFYPDGARALFDGNRLLDHAAADRRRTMGEALIEGDAGALRLDGEGALEHRAYDENAWRRLDFPAPQRGFGGDCVHALQAHVVEGVRGGGPLENEAASYLEVMRIEEAIYRSNQDGRRVRL